MNKLDMCKGVIIGCSVHLCDISIINKCNIEKHCNNYYTDFKNYNFNNENVIYSKTRVEERIFYILKGNV